MLACVVVSKRKITYNSVLPVTPPSSVYQRTTPSDLKKKRDGRRIRRKVLRTYPPNKHTCDTFTKDTNKSTAYLVDHPTALIIPFRCEHRRVGVVYLIGGVAEMTGWVAGDERPHVTQGIGVRR